MDGVRCEFVVSYFWHRPVFNDSVAFTVNLWFSGRLIVDTANVLFKKCCKIKLLPKHMLRDCSWFNNVIFTELVCLCKLIQGISLSTISRIGIHY